IAYPRRTTRTALDGDVRVRPPVIASPQAACAAATMNENALHYAAVSAVLAGSSPVFGVGADPCASACGRRSYVGSAYAVCRRGGRSDAAISHEPLTKMRSLTT